MLLLVRLSRALLVFAAVVVALLMFPLLAVGRQPHNIRYVRAFAAHHQSPSEATSRELATATREHYWGFFWRELVLAAVLIALVAGIVRSRERTAAKNI